MSPSVGYVDQVVDGSRDDIAFRSLGGVRSRTDADIVHLDRLSSLGGSQRRGAAERIALSLALAARVVRKDFALVRTWHGSDAARTGEWSSRIANGILNRVTSAFVTVDSSTRPPRGRSTVVIPFGHYRDRFIGYPTAAPTSGRMLCVGPSLGRGTTGLVEQFLAAGFDGTSLRVVGMPGEATAALERLAGNSGGRVAVRLERVSDGTMVQEITGAEIVVLTSVDELDDLHVALLALSLDRPVLVPDTALTRSLADQIGHEWVRIAPTMDASGLSKAIASLRTSPPSGRPELAGRDQPTTTAAYASVFLDITQS